MMKLRELKQKRNGNSRSFSAPGATRTHDPLVRNQVLYPLSYEGMSVFSPTKIILLQAERNSNMRFDELSSRAILGATA